MPILPLSKLRLGRPAIIRNLGGTSQTVRGKLMEMGLTSGVIVEVIRYAPLGDPIEIVVRGYRLTLRLNEAEIVFVEVT